MRKIIIIFKIRLKTRKQFVALLRFLNKTTKIKWSRVCHLERVLQQFETEKREDIQEDMACLIRYTYFRFQV